MKTAAQLETAFRRDFDKLLKKHNAEIEITDDGASYGTHIGIVIVTIPSNYGKYKNALENEFCEFNL